MSKLTWEDLAESLSHANTSQAKEENYEVLCSVLKANQKARGATNYFSGF